MPAVDFNAVAAAAVEDLQAAIDNLNLARRQTGADIDDIESKIEALQQQQEDFRTVALGQIVESPENKDALAAVDKAATDLSAEAGNIADVASAIQTADKVLGYATDLAKALAAFA